MRKLTRALAVLCLVPLPLIAQRSKDLLVGAVSALALVNSGAVGNHHFKDSLEVSTSILPSRLLFSPSSDTVQFAPSRGTQAWKGVVIGGLVGGALGAVGGAFYHTGCDATNDGCHIWLGRLSLMAFTGVEGALAGGTLGGLFGLILPTNVPSSNRLRAF
jgi:hypothetical protein